MSEDPRTMIAIEPMTWRQVAVVALSVLLTALDGFDVLAISFAAPGIATEWGIDRSTLGFVLSIELIGMAIGSVTLGKAADSFGRRPTVLGCLAIMTLGMFLAMTADGVQSLSLYRFFTGLGIGGMLAAVSAVAAEFSNDRRRNLCVTLMAAGYPLGAVFGGLYSARLLVDGSWRSVFEFGAYATAISIPVVLFMLPESVSYLVERRPQDALARVNATLRRLGHAAIDALPAAPTASQRASWLKLLQPGMARTTLLLTAAYFAHIMTFYFMLKWIPKLVVDMGFHPSSASGVLVWANVGGATGAVAFSLLTQRFGLKSLLVGALAITTVLVARFGRTSPDLVQLAALAATTGFFCNAAIVGLYAMFAQSFPTAIRASGTGFVIGVGRGGAACGPIAAGFLFDAGTGLPAVTTIMAAGSLVAAAAILLLRYKERPVF